MRKVLTAALTVAAAVLFVVLSVVWLAPTTPAGAEPGTKSRGFEVPTNPDMPTHVGAFVAPPGTVATVLYSYCSGQVSVGTYIFNAFAKLDHLGQGCHVVSMKITLVIYIEGYGLRNVGCNFGDQLGGCSGSVELRSEQATIVGTYFGFVAKLCTGGGCGEISGSIYG